MSLPFRRLAFEVRLESQQDDWHQRQVMPDLRAPLLADADQGRRVRQGEGQDGDVGAWVRLSPDSVPIFAT